jgi:hypothetical protein
MRHAMWMVRVAEEVRLAEDAVVPAKPCFLKRLRRETGDRLK